MGCYKVPSAPLTSPLTKKNRLKRKMLSETRHSKAKPTDVTPPLTKTRGFIHPKPWTPNMIKSVDFIHLEKPIVKFEFSDEIISGEFLEYQVSGMFLDVYALVKNVFGGDDLEAATSPWARPFSEDFYQHAKAIARADPHSAHWEALLRNGTERIFLVCAIVMRVLDAKVFSSLMFGASTEHEALLQEQDINMVKWEGFERSQVLSKMVKDHLSANASAPPRFWGQVQRVTSQITCMLLPLYNVVGKESSDGMPPLKDFAQGLLDIVTVAGWLNVMTRVSPGILTLSWVPPGEDYDISQVNLLHEIYELSELNAEDYDEQNGKPESRRTARVMMSLAPAVEYSYQSQASLPSGTRKYDISEIEDALRGEPLCHTYTVLKPHVLYYSGLTNSRDDDMAVYPLSKYVDDVRMAQKRHRRLSELFHLIFRIAFVACIIWVSAVVVCRSKREGLGIWR